MQQFFMFTDRLAKFKLQKWCLETDEDWTAWLDRVRSFLSVHSNYLLNICVERQFFGKWVITCVSPDCSHRLPVLIRSLEQPIRRDYNQSGHRYISQTGFTVGYAKKHQWRRSVEK